MTGLASPNAIEFQLAVCLLLRIIVCTATTTTGSFDVGVISATQRWLGMTKGVLGFKRRRCMICFVLFRKCDVLPSVFPVTIFLNFVLPSRCALARHKLRANNKKKSIPIISFSFDICGTARNPTEVAALYAKLHGGEPRDWRSFDYSRRTCPQQIVVACSFAARSCCFPR